MTSQGNDNERLNARGAPKFGGVDMPALLLAADKEEAKAAGAEAKTAGADAETAGAEVAGAKATGHEAAADEAKVAGAEGKTAGADAQPAGADAEAAGAEVAGAEVVGAKAVLAGTEAAGAKAVGAGAEAAGAKAVGAGAEAAGAGAEAAGAGAEAAGAGAEAAGAGAEAAGAGAEAAGAGAEAAGAGAEAAGAGAEAAGAGAEAAGAGAEAAGAGAEAAGAGAAVQNAAAQGGPLRTNERNRRFFEGCGEEGPLRAIFLSEFHTTQGPMIRTQVPREVVSKELFDVFSTFVIPKQQLTSRTITTTTLDFKILGYPVVIENKKYKRNQYMFNVCFVCYPWSRSVQYESAVRTLVNFLADLEKEEEFLTAKDSNADDKIRKMLQSTFEDLNTKKEVTLVEHGLVCQFKVTRSYDNPEEINAFSVPLFIMGDPKEFGKDSDDLDLTIKKILPYINGFNHVGKIAQKSSVGQEMVIRAVQELCYFGSTQLLPIFLWTNMYRSTPSFNNVHDDSLRSSLLEIANRNVPESKWTEFRPIVYFLCELKHNVEIRQVMDRHKLRLPDEFENNLPHLIQFAVSHNLIARAHRYAYFNQQSFRAAGGEKLNADETFSVVGDGPRYSICSIRQMRELFDGKRHFDMISTLLAVTQKELSDFVEKEVHVNVFCK